MWASLRQKVVREKSRECHNHKSQPFPDAKRKRKQTKPNKDKSNKLTKTLRWTLCPNLGYRNAKRTEKHNYKKTCIKTCVTSKNSDQPLHPPSIASVLVHPLDRRDSVECICNQQWLWSDCTDAQTDLDFRRSNKSYCRFCRAIAHSDSEIMCKIWTLMSQFRLDIFHILYEVI